MAKPISFGELGFKIVASMDETRGVPESEAPFHILIMGDFSGRENLDIPESGAALASRRAIEVDRDNLNEVMARMKPEIRLLLAGPESDALTIRITELDDFHPDRLYKHCEIFEPIREISRKRDNPRTFEEAAKEIRSWPKSQAAVEKQEPPKPAPDTSEWCQFLKK